MTNDPRDVEAAERANLEVYPTYIFKATGGADRYAILAAKYAREAAEARLGVQTDETHLEPLAKGAWNREEALLASIAVSLKRIAAYKAGKEAANG